MAWCRQATSHYLSQCWPRSRSPYGVTRPQWVKLLLLRSFIVWALSIVYMISRVIYQWSAIHINHSFGSLGYPNTHYDHIEPGSTHRHNCNRILCFILAVVPPVTSTSIFLTFSRLFPDQFQLLLTFCSTKIWCFDLCRNFVWITKMQNAFCSDHWVKRSTICHLYAPQQLSYGLIYKMSKCHRNALRNFLAFLVNDRENKHIMTLTVVIWNEGFILISNPFCLTFSRLFREFQHFLAHIKISWLFPDFLRFSLFPNFFQAFGNPDFETYSLYIKTFFVYFTNMV